jgi:trehalose-6-phosphatase
VLNLIPPGAPDKGEALAALLAQSRAAIMRLIGDDASDEAVFRLRSRRC